MVHEFKWNVFQTIGIQVINFVFSILLARILGPSEFGLVALCMVIITIAQTLMNGGLSESVMRLKEPSDQDYSALFVLNLVLSILLFLSILIFRVPLSKLLGASELVVLLPIISTLLLINSFSISQSTRLNRVADFKTQFWINVPATIVSSFIGLAFALNGFGAYSLIYMQIAFASLATIALWWNSKWRPSFRISKEKIVFHLKFGLPLTYNGLLTGLATNLNSFIIGKYFSAADLGIFNRALAFKNLPISNASNIIEKNTFPLLANKADDKDGQKQLYSQLTAYLFAFFIPLSFYLILNAELIFKLVLGDKWMNGVFYFQLLLIGSAFEVATRMGINILKVGGLTRYLVFTESLLNGLTVMASLMAIYFGLTFLTCSLVFFTLLRFSLVQFKLNNYFGTSILSLKYNLNAILTSFFLGMVFFLIYNYSQGFYRLFFSTAVFITVCFVQFFPHLKNRLRPASSK